MAGERSAEHPDYGAEIPGIKAEQREMRRSIDVLFGKMDTQSTKLDAITTALHEMKGARGPSIKDMVIIIGVVAALVSSVCGGIVYLAAGANVEALHKLDNRLIALEVRQSLGKMP